MTIEGPHNRPSIEDKQDGFRTQTLDQTSNDDTPETTVNKDEEDKQDLKQVILNCQGRRNWRVWQFRFLFYWYESLITA